VALKTYWCVLYRRKTTPFLHRTVFRQATAFSCELDLGEGMGYTIRAALLTGAEQHGGQGADAVQYRMDIYDARDGTPQQQDFIVPREPAVYRTAESLADYPDDELISELAQRLRER
jgi:hypothetical protein